MANLERAKGTGKVPMSPLSEVTVFTPTFSDLQGAGVIPTKAGAVAAYAVVEVVTDLRNLPDIVTPGPHTAEEWGALVEGKQPNGILTFGGLPIYVNIIIVYETGDGSSPGI